MFSDSPDWLYGHSIVNNKTSNIHNLWLFIFFAVPTDEAAGLTVGRCDSEDIDLVSEMLLSSQLMTSEE